VIGSVFGQAIIFCRRLVDSHSRFCHYSHRLSGRRGIRFRLIFTMTCAMDLAYHLSQ
jgi:hypothetical protein